MSTEKAKKPTCYAPFFNVYLRSSSKESRVCCTAGQSHHLKSNEMSEVFNNPTAIDIREAMLKGEWHPACYGCYEKEQLNEPSDRQVYNDWYTEAVKQNNIDPNNPLELEMDEPIWADIRPSNLCNLKCRMCYPDNSTEVAREQADILKDNKDTFQVLEKIPLNKLEEYSQRKHYTLPALNKLINIKLLGGEPTLQSEVFDIIDQLEPNDHRFINITTNASSKQQLQTIIPKLKDVAQVMWNISIDGVCDHFEYVRTPAKWDRFNECVQYLKETKVARHNTLIGFNFCVQAWNWESVPLVLDYCESMAGSRYAINMVDQNHLGLAVIPLDARERLLSTLEKKGCRRRETMKKWCQSIPFQAELLPKFWQHTVLLDQQRGTSFPELNPLLAESMLKHL